MLPYADVRQLGGILQRKGYKVFLRGGSMYAFKGLAGKLGPIGVHAAMLLVMAGTPAAQTLPSSVRDLPYQPVALLDTGDKALVVCKDAVTL